MKRVVGEKDAIWRRDRAFVFVVFRNSSVVLTILLGHAYIVAERGIGGGRMVVAFLTPLERWGRRAFVSFLLGRALSYRPVRLFLSIRKAARLLSQIRFRLSYRSD